jgi:hypothetical protein
MNWPRALLTTACTLLACAPTIAQQPVGTITSAHASVTIKGHFVDGALTYDRVGDLTLWGPGGGLIDLGNEKGDAFQYSAMPTPGKFKTTPAMPIVVQVGVGPEVKVIASSAGECTVTLTRADDTGVTGSFECGKVVVLGPEKKILGPIDSMTGSFTATR